MCGALQHNMLDSGSEGVRMSRCPGVSDQWARGLGLVLIPLHRTAAPPRRCAAVLPSAPFVNYPCCCSLHLHSSRTHMLHITAAGKKGKAKKVRRHAGIVKYDVLEAKEFLERRNGVKLTKVRKHMWQRQYVLWAQSVDGGLLTPEEAESNWSKFIEEWKLGQRTSDNDGPRGFFQVACDIGTSVEKYEDISSGKKQEGVAARVRNADAEAAEAMAQSVLCDFNNSSIAGLSGVGDLMERAAGQLSAAKVQSGGNADAGDADDPNQQAAQASNAGLMKYSLTKVTSPTKKKQKKTKPITW
jgi:hypothetical protein